jgi:hypothetical protein
VIRLEWVQDKNFEDVWYYQDASAYMNPSLGSANHVGWDNEITAERGDGDSIEANKAACEASVKQSIRELAAWVEQEEQA